MTVKADPGGFPQRRLAGISAVTPAQMRSIQRVAQEDYGVDILQIMENAGRATARLALAMLGGRARGQRIVILAGGGNKGGAGLVAARHLVNWGFLVDPIIAEVEEEMSFIARRQMLILRQAGVVGPADTSEYVLEETLARADLVIDALVGYGLEGPPMGMAAAVAQLAVDARRPILAVDLPTGLNAGTGEVAGLAIRAVTTLMLDLPKRGLTVPAARPYVGELFLADLGIPLQVYEHGGVSLGDVFAEGPVVRVRR
jgi:hydroxyethylthiazole kinase-like uncharacterized protein yjeF